MPRLCTGAGGRTSQFAYVPGRRAAELMAILKGALKYAKAEQRRFIFLCLDAKRAFDLLQWDVIFDHLMPALGFKPGFIRMVRSLYLYSGEHGKVGARAQLLINGRLGPLFHLGRGVRQGEPCAALLYALVMELMEAAVEVIEREPGGPARRLGVRSPCGRHFCVGKYADDVTAILRSANDVPAFMRAVALFNSATGGDTNLDKSEAFAMVELTPGEVASISGEGLKLLATHEHAKHLGVRIGPSMTATEQWAPVLDRLRVSAQRFKRFGLTIFGRTLVAKMYITAFIWYMAPVYEMPDTTLAEVKCIIASWLWARQSAAGGWAAHPWLDPRGAGGAARGGRGFWHGKHYSES